MSDEVVVVDVFSSVVTLSKGRMPAGKGDSMAAMEEAFEKDLYTYHYKALSWIGLWTNDFKNTKKNRIFFAYRCLILTYSLGSTSLTMCELYRHRNNIKQISYNLSTTFLVLGMMMKLLSLLTRSDQLNQLRWDLFKDAWYQTDPADVKINEEYKKLLFLLRKLFYYSVGTFLPVWLCASLLTLAWPPRQMPFSIWIPVNLENNTHFAAAFVFHFLFSIYVALEAIHSKLSFYSIILQLSAQYKILIRNVYAIQGNYQTPLSNYEKPNFIKSIRDHEAKKSLRKCLIRHLKLGEYAKTFEYCERESLSVGFLLAMALITVNSLEVLQSLSTISLRWYYQVSYTFIITVDILITDSMGNVFQSQREKLVQAVYDLPWYEMNYSLQKDILFAIVGMQRNLTLTMFKVFHLDVTLFAWMIKSIAGVLALFWQLMNRQ